MCHNVAMLVEGRDKTNVRGRAEVRKESEDVWVGEGFGEIGFTE